MKNDRQHSEAVAHLLICIGLLVFVGSTIYLGLIHDPEKAWSKACIDSGGTPRLTMGTRNEKIGRHIVLCDYPTIEDPKE